MAHTHMRGMAHTRKNALGGEKWHTHTWMLLEEMNGTHTYMNALRGIALGEEEWHTHTHTGMHTHTNTHAHTGMLSEERNGTHTHTQAGML